MKFTHAFGSVHQNSPACTISTPETPGALDDFLWKDAEPSGVHQTGVGTCDIQPGDQEATQVFTGAGRVCDIEGFGRDHLMSRLIYLRDNEQGTFWNAGWAPGRAPYESYGCEHGHGFSGITSETNGVQAGLLIVVPPGDAPVKQWRLELVNRSGRPRDLTVFASDRTPDGYDGSRRFFAGDYRTLAAPDAVVKGACPPPGSREATIAALQFNCALPPDGEDAIEFVNGLTDSPETDARLRKQHAGQAHRALEAVNNAIYANGYYAPEHRNIPLRADSISASPAPEPGN